MSELRNAIAAYINAAGGLVKQPNEDPEVWKANVIANLAVSRAERIEAAAQTALGCIRETRESVEGTGLSLVVAEKELREALEG